MVDGVLGEHVVELVVLEFRQEHVHIQHRHLEDLCVEDLQKKCATPNRVLVINLEC